MKLYEEHQKQETKPINRPVSSYHHYHNVQQQNENIVNSETKHKNKPQSAQTSSHHSQQSHLQRKNEPEKTFEQLINELNEFIIKNKITRSQFSENENIFVTFDDFKQILHNIHYTINSSYMKILFNNNNPTNEDKDGGNENKEDEFLYLKLFIKNITFYKSNENIHGETESNFNNTSDLNSKSNINNSQSNKLQKKTKYYIDSNNNTKQQNNDSQNGMSYLNEEFSKFNKDINAILLNDKLNEKKQPPRIQTAKPSQSKSSIHNISQSKKIYSHNQNSIFPSKSLNESSTLSKHSQQTEQQSIEKDSETNKFLFRDHALEKKKLDEKVRKQCEQMNRKKEKQIIQENEEYNKICDELKKIGELKEFEKYNIGFDAEKVVRCFEQQDHKEQSSKTKNKDKNDFQTKMSEKWAAKKKGKKDYLNERENQEEEKYPSITMKAFHVEWRIKNKQYIHNKDMYKGNGKGSNMNDINKEAQTKKGKDKEHNEKNADKKGEMNKEIKEVLIETVRLKTKLKMQLKNLQKKVNINKDVVIEHLIKAGVTVPQVNKEEEKEDDYENDKERIKKMKKKHL